MLRSVIKALHVLRGDGIEVLRGKLSRRGAIDRQRKEYNRWIERYDTFSEADHQQMRLLITKFHHKPLISIVMPVYNTDACLLRNAIDSVRAQLYENWELCIADDRSTLPHVRWILEDYSQLDPRIKILFRATNGHISAASNSALEIATGEFTALMDHDDKIPPQALYFVAKEINEHPNAQIIYTDEDKIDLQGTRFAPFFKPDWNPDLLYSVNYINHLVVYRTSLLRDGGGFRIGLEGSQDYDLLLRASEHVGPDDVRHIPRILYHWRAIRGSVAHLSSEKQYAHDRARRAIADHFTRREVGATVTRGVGELHRVTYQISRPPPSISFILDGESQRYGIRSIIERSAGKSLYEIIDAPDGEITNAEKVRPAAEKDQTGRSHQRRFELLDLAAQSATGDLLCFLDSGTIDASRGWLEILAGHAQQKDIGAAGPMLVFRDDKIKSAGLVIGAGLGVASGFADQTSRPRGRALRLDVSQNVSAVPADCMFVRRDVYKDCGGFDSTNYPDRFADVDLCLRLMRSGYRIIWTPWARLAQASSLKYKQSAELELLRSAWPWYFEHDPHYNPNLSLASANWELAFPPRAATY